MIVEELRSITSKSLLQKKSVLYTKSLLKEFLQIYVLNFIFLHPLYSKIFIFTGGTCLKHCFGLNRLSEDLDFDLKEAIDPIHFKTSLENYFKKEYLYPNIQASVLQRGSQILLKFSVLKELNLSSDEGSDLLFVKIDLSIIISTIYQSITTLKSTNNFNYLVTHYDLETLMASKMVTILTRNRKWGKDNASIVKGRDYFDLLWFLEKKIKPILSRVNDLLKANYSMNDLIQLIDQKVMNATTIYRQSFKQDLLPFMDNSAVLDSYLENFQINYTREKQYLKT
jgi:hypothetical protein